MIVLKCPNCEHDLELRFDFRPLVTNNFSVNEPPTWKLTPLSILKLSARMEHCFKNEGYVTIGDIASQSDRDLLRIPNFGRKSLLEVRNLIDALKRKTEEFSE